MFSRPSTKTSWPDIINLLSEIVVFNQYNFKDFLKKLLEISNEVIPVDSCLVYFYDKDSKELSLIASKKPHEKAIGNITIRQGEGITGWVAEHKKTVAIYKNAYSDSRFKFFKELPEDKYEAFLSVPILDSEGVVGVMNFQNKKPYDFSEEQVIVIEAICKIISSVFAKTLVDKKINALEEKLEERKIVEKAKGILMKAKNISENDAFKIMRSEAMNKRKSMKEIAEAILLVWQ
ncbi:MAG TPA: ANTAR domain-containing protein [Patescibacteria group bacterium]